jgi:hypothetical protein
VFDINDTGWSAIGTRRTTFSGSAIRESRTPSCQREGVSGEAKFAQNSAQSVDVSSARADPLAAQPMQRLDMIATWRPAPGHIERIARSLGHTVAWRRP